MKLVTVCLSGELNCTQSVVMFAFSFIHLPLRDRSMKIPSGYFLVVIYVEEQLLYKYHPCFSLF